ncbi:MAG: S46 family peptidase [Bacteroidales bacterium]|nr:S46 family peptidase [Bacteroidales bacterium]
MKSKILLTSVAVLLSTAALADEGMWMVSPGQNFADAVVSLDFGCSGSFISDNGLIITNHHCAYSDVYGLSTNEHNYLEDGFWAMTAAEEAPIPGKGIQLLRAMIDVTDEANEIVAKEKLEGKPMGIRRLSYLLEKKYKEETGLEASLSSMWAGSRYYMALYVEYKDVRLVAAPPVSISAFGGDIDNWEWPQHKCDFALYRVYSAPDGSPAEYSADNVPLKSPMKLEISLDGVAPGDSTFVIGYPGSTDRFASSAKVAYKRDIKYPCSTSLQGRKMEIIKGWMDRDPEIRLKYSDYFFSLSNVQELRAGEAACYARFGVEEEKKAIEDELQEWIDASEERSAKWGTLLRDLDVAYKSIYDVDRQTIAFREAFYNGTKLSIMAGRFGNHSKDAAERLVKGYEDIDLRVERDLLRFSLEVIDTKVDHSFFGPFIKATYAKFTDDGGKCDYDAMTSYLWDDCVFVVPSRIEEVAAGSHIYEDDPFFKFFTDMKITVFNNEKTRIEGDKDLTALNREYTHALYEMRMEKGIPTYPDANSTMRLTRGTVSSSLEPRDGVVYGWQSTARGIIEKYDPTSYDFSLKDDWRAMIAAEPALPVNFITDNDITGGNSGSAVVDGSGRLAGLAFDGNKESLAGDSSFTGGYNKCVCVDIRFVVWTLRNYAKLDYILDEINISK